MIAKLFVLTLLASLAAPALAADPTTVEAMHLLKSNCFSCHNDQKKKGGLVMTSREALLKGGDNGAALDLNSPEKSVLLESLAADADPHMPPKKQLSAPQIDVLKRWAQAGAAWDASSLVTEPSAARTVAIAALPAAYRPVLALALSPDSTRLAVGCGNEVVLYDVTAAKPTVVARASGHLDPVQSIAWSPDGRQLVTGAFRRVVVWSASELTKEREITEGLTDRIAALRFLPDGKQFVIADGRVAETGTVRIADAVSGAITASWTAHADTIFDLAVSSDGKLLATAGGDRLVKIWDLATHAEIAKLEGHVAQVLTLAFDANATQLVTGGMDQQLKVWDVKTREKINSLGTQTAAITAVAWSPAGSAVVAVTDAGSVMRYTELQSHTGGQRSESAKERKLEATDAALHCVAVTTNGERVFAGSQDGRLFSWNKDGKLDGKLAVQEAPVVAAPSPSFVRDVLPVLSKAGCSAGACHAKPEGQNGFHLTVFSYDPKSDYRQILQDARGRRVFPAAPEESLILLKATETVPHEGGERFAKDSDAYRTLVQWIRGGMIYRGENEPSLQRISVQPAEHTYRKGETQQLKVQAFYSDGSERDVTALASFASNDKEIARITEDGRVTAGKVSGQAVIVARFMGLVGDSRIGVPADRLLPEAQYASLPVKNFIDELAYAQFQRLGLFPSEPCTDAEYLRRATLDTIGALPSPQEARDFLADTSPDKREKLIDRLLAHPFYADYWANKWADLLRPNSDRVGIKSVNVLDQWLRENFRANRPYDQFVRDIVLTEGNTHRFGPAVIYRDRREPADLTTMFSQLFLGVRLDCAKCHHHPNEKWGQEDFYKMAAFFGPLKRKGAGISAPISAGNETLYFAPGKTVKHPVTGELMDPQAPDGPPVKAGDDTDPRRALADWLTDPQNPFFARALVNRVWASFFGKGIVDPVDDFRISNPPSNPALLDALAQELVRQKFDLKALMRTILRSHLYQLSAVPNEFNRADTRNFSRAYRRRLPAEVLADALADVTGVPDSFAGMPPGSRAMQAWTYKIDSQTMDAFGRPNSSTDCPCERDTRPSIVQSLHLMNSRLLQEKLASKNASARTQRLAEGKLTPEEIVTDLYLTCYTRPPTDEELKIATAPFTAEGSSRRTATEDVLWSLLNSAEFVFNH
jgi:WD40 repeat protein